MNVLRGQVKIIHEQLYESNKTTGNIGVEYLIFKYRLNIYEEIFFPINHNLIGIKGSKLKDITNVYSHAPSIEPSF